MTPDQKWILAVAIAWVLFAIFVLPAFARFHDEDKR